MTEHEPVLVDTEVVARLFNISTGTVRSWASRDHWTPHGTRRRRLWNLDDAEASWTRRNPDVPDATLRQP